MPQEISKVVGGMQPGDISEPFVMIDPKRNREMVAMVKLTSRLEGHKANLRMITSLSKACMRTHREGKY